MELLKSNLIIDPEYKPSLNMSYMDYFNRAMAFTQTNYHDRLVKTINTNFSKLSPTIFYEEYTWSVLCLDNNFLEASQLIPNVINRIALLGQSFWNLNSFPKTEDIKPKIMAIIHDEKKFNALYSCAETMNSGIKLFGWDTYKHNFLNSPAKLCVLPAIGVMGAKQLSRNIGATHDIVGFPCIQKLATHWGFEDATALCTDISKRVCMQPKIIEVILWYAAMTFDYS